MSGFSVVFGGGKFGCEAIKYLLSHSEPFIVIDEDRNCCAARQFNLAKISIDDFDHIDASKNYFVEGGVKLALAIIEKIKPKLVFPTAPIHVAASLLKEKYHMTEWDEAVELLARHIPSLVIMSIGRATIVTSYNRDAACRPVCTAPAVCPVTNLRKPYPMYELLKMSAPEGVILRSYQLKPGLGAIRGEELMEMLETCGHRPRVIIGTACECHGVITALKAP